MLPPGLGFALAAAETKAFRRLQKVSGLGDPVVQGPGGGHVGFRGLVFPELLVSPQWLHWWVFVPLPQIRPAGPGATAVELVRSGTSAPHLRAEGTVLVFPS